MRKLRTEASLKATLQASLFEDALPTRGARLKRRVQCRAEEQLGELPATVLVDLPAVTRPDGTVHQGHALRVKTSLDSKDHRPTEGVC